MQEGMLLEPELADQFAGLVPNALEFLAAYGVYVNVATDRVVGRLLDAEWESLGGVLSSGPRVPVVSNSVNLLEITPLLCK